MNSVAANCAYIALGANIGDAAQTVKTAMVAIDALPGCRVCARSSLYRTAPVGLLEQPDFINAVVAVETDLPAADLLQALFSIEQQYGRQRSVANAPRTLDLDLLLYADEVLNTATLTLPHPRMHDRAFVLAPLAEIAPALVLPGHGAITTLLADCADQAIQKLG